MNLLIGKSKRNGGKESVALLGGAPTRPPLDDGDSMTAMRGRGLIADPFADCLRMQPTIEYLVYYGPQRQFPRRIPEIGNGRQYPMGSGPLLIHVTNGLDSAVTPPVGE